MSLPGLTWRILAWNRRGHTQSRRTIDLSFVPAQKVEFDELVVGDWLHIEQMDDRRYWMRVGDYRIDVFIPAKGKPNVCVREEPE